MGWASVNPKAPATAEHKRTNLGDFIFYVFDIYGIISDPPTSDTARPRRASRSRATLTKYPSGQCFALIVNNLTNDDRAPHGVAFR
jgi:hypothetical protein